jgi:hypothetical protein
LTDSQESNFQEVFDVFVVGSVSALTLGLTLTHLLGQSPVVCADIHLTTPGFDFHNYNLSEGYIILEVKELII